MTKNKITVLSMLLAFTATPAMAASGGFFFEPMLTYQSSDAKLDYGSTLLNDSTGDADGGGFGLRLGMHANETVFVGLDGRYAQIQLKDGSNNYDAKTPEYNIAPIVGFQMPVVGLRIWGSYIVAGEANPDSSNGVDLKFTDANGYRLGAGFRVMAVSLNVEYQDFKYNTTSFEKVGFASSDVELKNQGYVASVSFPFEF